MGELGGKILKLSCDAVFYTSSHMLTSLNRTHSVHGFYDMKKLNQAASKMMPQSHGSLSYSMLPISRVSDFLFFITLIHFTNEFYSFLNNSLNHKERGILSV